MNPYPTTFFNKPFYISMKRIWLILMFASFGAILTMILNLFLIQCLIETYHYLT